MEDPASRNNAHKDFPDSNLLANEPASDSLDEFRFVPVSPQFVSRRDGSTTGGELEPRTGDLRKDPTSLKSFELPRLSIDSMVNLSVMPALPTLEPRLPRLNEMDKFQENVPAGLKAVLDRASKVLAEPEPLIRRDARNCVEEVLYPGGKKTRSFRRDDTGAVNSITTRDESGERTYVKAGKKWFISLDGMQLELPGNIHVSGNGDVSFEVKPGVWQTERANGLIVQEKANGNGSRVSMNKNGQAEKIVRKDGSSVEAMYDEKGQLARLIESNGDGSVKATWINAGGRFEDRSGNGHCKHIEVMSNGITVLQAADGRKKIILGDGKALIEDRLGKFTFDNQGRFDSITYPDGNALKFQYDTAGEINAVTKSLNGKVVKTSTRDANSNRWQRKDGAGEDLGDWHGQIKLTPSAEVRTRDSQDSGALDYWTVLCPDGSTYKEKINDDGSRKVVHPDNTTVEISKEGSVCRVATSKDNYRLFDYDQSGQLTKVTDFRKGNEASSWSHKADGLEKRTNIGVSIHGDLTYNIDGGAKVIEKANQTKIELDAFDHITKVLQPDGRIREFTYTDQDDQKKLVAITDRRGAADKQVLETWSRKANSDGSLSNTFVRIGKNGAEKTRTDITLAPNGDYQYTTSDGQTHVSKAHRDSSDENSFSDSVEEARDRLVESMEAHLDEPRRQRFQSILNRFEQRSRDRVEAQIAGGMEPETAQQEWDQKVSRTFDHLAHMIITNDSGAIYDAKTRAKLVENAVFAMAWPAKANDQGNWGCCWQIAGIYLGVSQHPDKMAKMLDELSTTGKFTDINGKTWAPPSHLLQFSEQGASWTIASCGDTRRSPVSEIWTSVAAYLSQDGRRMDRGAYGGTMEACMHSMRLITGDTWRGTYQMRMTDAQYKQELLLKGGVILHSPGHMYLGLLEKNKGQWQAISSVQHGDGGRHVNGIISDLHSWRVERSRHQYIADMPNFPPCNDEPIGRNGPLIRPRTTRWQN